MGVTPSVTLPPSATNTTILPRHVVTSIVPGQMYFVSLSKWLLIAVVAWLVPLLTVHWYELDSMWIGVGLALAVVIVLQTGFAVSAVPWIPGLIMLVAVLQWVLGPWAAYHVPPFLPTFAMPVPAPDYFSYAVPATVLFAVGLYLPLWRLGRRSVRRVAPAVPVDFARTCDLMILVGLVASVGQVMPLSLTWMYTVLLVAYLSFVGAFGLLLARATGWGWRLAAVLGLRAVLTSSDGMFHDLLLWLAYSLALLGFIYRWRARTLAILAVTGFMLIGTLNEIKFAYREQLVENPDLPFADRASVLGEAFVQQIREPGAAFRDPGLSHTVTRVNQGWIIARTIFWVPAREPYAHGETLVNAVRAAVLPRVLAPTKYYAGGYWYVQRFTGIIIGKTSMNLSVPGEMYANFGPNGGLIGVFLFAVLLGLVYRFFLGRGVQNPLWWAWAPYVMLYTMQAENGIGEAVNHVVKSSVVMFTFMSVVPAWQTLRRWHLRRPRARSAEA